MNADQSRPASGEPALAPKVSFGIPVRNGVHEIGHTIDSILSQDFRDFEIVISDNCSDDGTRDLLEAYAAKDKRIRLALNDVNIGQDPNFNRVLELARGEYFRWIGVEDTIDPTYASRCVAVLDNMPEVIGVSSYTRYIDKAGNILYAEYRGERLESTRPERRFARTLWFLLADYRYFDPIYNMTRRSVLLQTHRLRAVPVPDQTLSTEMSLIGPVHHIPECLSTRYRDPAYYENKKKLAAQYNPKAPGIIHASAWVTALNFAEVAWQSPRLNVVQKLMCAGSALRYCMKRSLRTGYRSLRDATPVWVRHSLKPRRSMA